MLKKSLYSLESIVCFVYISAAHSKFNLPVIILIEAIFWEATHTNLQGWIISPVLVHIEFLMSWKHVYIHIIDNEIVKLRVGKYDFMGPLIWKEF